jgi:hypothetical protein
MVITKVDSILQDLFLDPWRDAVNVRGSSDPPVLPKVEVTTEWILAYWRLSWELYKA